MESSQYPIQRRLEDAASVNSRLVSEFKTCESSDDIRRSHLFEGRYENIYVTTDHMPTLTSVIEAARRFAAELLSADSQRIGVGYWMNAMRPGHVTLPHTHDDDDELLSGVYYIVVPPDSGDLLLSTDLGIMRMVPEAGAMAFFPPDLEHEVTRHEGEGLRLSLGMNFGIKPSY